MPIFIFSKFACCCCNSRASKIKSTSLQQLINQHIHINRHCYKEITFTLSKIQGLSLSDTTPTIRSRHLPRRCFPPGCWHRPASSVLLEFRAPGEFFFHFSLKYDCNKGLNYHCFTNKGLKSLKK